MTLSGLGSWWTAEPLQIRISPEEVLADLLAPAVAEAPKQEPVGR